MAQTTSPDSFASACKLIPGGVNSPVRAYKSVGIEPRFVDRAKGSHIWDVDGREYVDFVASWGPMILGRAPEEILSVVREQIERGTSYGAPTCVEIAAAEAVAKAVPSIDMVRFVSSGTEATMSAIRLARGYTGRNKFIKFDGNYHGHSDALLVKAGSGLLTLGIPGTPGVTPGATGDTIVLPYNDIDAVKEALESNAEEVAAIIVEPIAGNMGVVPPKEGFLQGLRDLCDRHGILLIADEIQSGAGRTGRMWAIEHWGVEPDILLTAKGIASGMPIGAMVARADLLEAWSPGAHGSTFGGNPVSCAAALATIDLLRGGLIDNAATRGEQALDGLRPLLTRFPDLVRDVRGKGLMLGVELDTAEHAEEVQWAAFQRGLLVLECGTSSVRMSPPLTVTEAEMASALAIFAEGVAAVAQEPGEILVEAHAGHGVPGEAVGG
jgi:glutamate-1-semialdehyde 2,1-aminomutase